MDSENFKGALGTVRHVAVLMGGPSTEHDVSVLSGRAIAKALLKYGYKVEAIEFSEPALPSISENIDVVFPALHGEFGEDGKLQSLLEQKGIHYVGSDATASRLIIDKHRTKKVLNQSNITVAPGCLLKSPRAEIPAELNFPLIVKPNRLGSTIGLSLVSTPDELKRVLDEIFQHYNEILVESYISGTEVTVGLIDGKALPVVEIIPPGEIFDYDAKYEYRRGKTQYLCPPENIDLSVQVALQEIAEKVYSAVGARDMLRVDMIVEIGTGTPTVLESNSIPGFTENSLYPKAAAEAGFSFEELCNHLVSKALSRQRHTN